MTAINSQPNTIHQIKDIDDMDSYYIFTTEIIIPKKDLNVSDEFLKDLTNVPNYFGLSFSDPKLYIVDPEDFNTFKEHPYVV